MTNKFKIGDTVKRRFDVFNENSAWMRGIIIEIYSYRSSHHGYYPELYKVDWTTHSRIEYGFLPHGLIKDD